MMTPPNPHDPSAAYGAYVVDPVDETGELPADPVLLATLAELALETPPPALRHATLATALRRRRPGTVPSAEMTPVEAFRRSVVDLDALLAELGPTEWSTPAHTGTVQSLIGHLAGVDRYMLAKAGQGPHPDPALDTDHLGVTAASIEAASHEAAAETRARWRQGADSFIALGHTRSVQETLPTHGLAVTTGGAFLLRTFEVWTHTEDICRAVGRRLSPPDADRLELMSSALCDVLVAGMHLSGVARDEGQVTIRLTGSGGGVYSHRLGPDDGGPEVVITADVVDTCRLASRRLRPDDLEATITGDSALAADVFVGLAAFALD